jgi:hypothetical protein
MAKRDEIIETNDPAGPEIDVAGVTDLLMQLGETPSEAKVHLYRVRVGIRPPFAFLEETTAGEFDIADVKARYGGGEFLVRVWQRGVPGFKISQRFSIEGATLIAPNAPPAPPVTVPGATPGAAPIILPHGDNSAAFAAIARVMQDGFAQQSALLAQALNNRSHGGGMQETLQLLTVAKNLFASNGGGDQLKMIGEVLGIVREVQPLTGEGGKADGWSLLQSLAEKVLPAIIERSAGAAVPALAAPNDAGEFAPASPPAVDPYAFVPPPAYNRGPQPQPQPQAQPNPAGDPMLTRIQIAMTFLAAQAAKGAEPDAYAQLALDSADDATLLTFIHQPDWFERVCKLAPQAATQRAWWDRLRALLIEALASEPGDESQPSVETSFFGDPAGNAQMQ